MSCFRMACVGYTQAINDVIRKAGPRAGVDEESKEYYAHGQQGVPSRVYGLSTVQEPNRREPLNGDENKNPRGKDLGGSEGREEEVAAEFAESPRVSTEDVPDVSLVKGEHEQRGHVR